MTREEFIDRWRNDLAGMVLDAATQDHKGAAFALWARTVLARVDARLGQMYDGLKPKELPNEQGQRSAPNGQTGKPAAKQATPPARS